jgi:hypothetical protein
VTRTGDATGEEKVTVPALCDGNELRTGHCDESELRAVYERYGRPPWIGFQLETRNDVWAAATEATLLDGVAQIPGLPTITSIGVECRESLCRLVITFPLQDSSGGGRPSNNVLGFAGDYLIPIFERVGLRTLRIDPRGTDASMVTYYLGP